MPDLLPPNSTALERALAVACEPTASPDVLRTLWNPDACPIDLLPWLAWSLSIKEWDDTWPEERKRSRIAEAFAIAKTEGTVASIRRGFASIGFGDITIDEGRGGFKHNGQMKRDGYVMRGPNSGRQWYRIRLKKLLNVRQAATAHRLLDATAPARCQLYGMDFTEATLLHNGLAIRDGSYTRGTV
jgi:phage tail P2-like protein